MATALLYGSAAFADSTIIGTVQSADTKKPIEGVQVTITSAVSEEEEKQGKTPVVFKEDFTTATGDYRLPQLQPGNYTLRFRTDSHKFQRVDLTVRLDRTVRVNVQLLPDSLTDTIDVVGKAPTIDVGSTTTGVNIDQEFVKRIAVNRPGGRGCANRDG